MSDIDELFDAAERAPEGDFSKDNSIYSRPSTSNKNISLSKPSSSTKSSQKIQSAQKYRKRKRVIESDSESDEESEESDEQSSGSESCENNTLNKLSVSGFDPSSFLKSIITNLEDKYKDDDSEEEEIDMLNFEVYKPEKKMSNTKNTNETGRCYQQKTMVNYQSNNSLLPSIPKNFPTNRPTNITVTRNEVMYKPPGEQPMNSALALPSSSSTSQILKSVNKVFDRTQMLNLKYQKLQLNDMLKQLFEESDNIMAHFLIMLAQKQLKTTHLPRVSKNVTPVIRFDAQQVPQFEYYLRPNDSFSTVELVNFVDDETINMSKLIYQFLEVQFPASFIN